MSNFRQPESKHDEGEYNQSSMPNKQARNTVQSSNIEGQDGNASAMPDPGSRRVFTMLENNPEVMTHLAHQLGASKNLRFHDVYSFSEPDLLSLIPRPVHALLVTIPITPQWKLQRDAEDAQTHRYDGAGSTAEPVVWFRQTIIHGCGLIGLLHCLCNGVPAETISHGSELDDLLKKAVSLNSDDRAELLNESDALYALSEAAASQGDTQSQGPTMSQRTGNHFVALVRGRDGTLWELEGSRKGPLDRGTLGPEEDALSERALDLGIRRLVELAQGSDAGSRFSCIALASSMD